MKLRKKQLTEILSTGILLVLLGSVNFLTAQEPADKQISNAVDNELTFNSSTPSYLIDVETNEGIVKLSGTVNNLLAEDRAVKIARTVKGVRGVVNNINVNVPYRSDAALENDVIDAFLDDPAADSYKLTVTANDGDVTIDGNVESWQEKQLAAFVAKGVRGSKKSKK